MGKASGAEKKETTTAPQAAPAAGAPQQHSHAPKPSTGGGKSKHQPIDGKCFAVGCKTNSHRFNFCDEHYDHFKFGLIKKTGEPVSDYEKKIEHYQAMVAARASNARKVA
jgi:hypothetical protein